MVTVGTEQIFPRHQPRISCSALIPMPNNPTSKLRANVRWQLIKRSSSCGGNHRYAGMAGYECPLFKWRMRIDADDNRTNCQSRLLQ